MGKLIPPSMSRLGTVDPKLQEIIIEAAKRLPFNCIVSEGRRTKEQAILNYCHGRTKAELLAVGISLPPLPGPKISWTLHSKHVDGKAVDIYPLRQGRLDDGTKGYEYFDELYHAIMAVAAEKKVRVRYGGDWDMDGKLREKGETDSPHFELA